MIRLIYKSRVLLLFLLVQNFIFAQISKTGNLTSHIDSMIAGMPALQSNNDYKKPGNNALTSWENAVSSMLTGDIASAHTHASAIGYRVINYTDNGVVPNKNYYILEKLPAGSNHWGTFILNPSPQRSKVFIQSPHPDFDFNTGKQGLYVFKNIEARAFIIAGASRCNNDTASTCAGTTTACNSPQEAFKISDQAHVTNSTFQKTTEVLNNSITGLIVVQLHGFEKLSEDPDLIMSTGISSSAPSVDYLNDVKTNLLNEDNSLTFKIAHIDTDWSRLTGTTNVQGRLINGANNPCSSTTGSSNTGRFLHIEQAKVKLRETQADWNKMANALAATFATDVLPVELVDFYISIIENRIILKWETATEVNNYGFEIERAPSLTSPVQGGGTGEWENIGFVAGNGNSNSPKFYEYVDYNPHSSDQMSGTIKYRLKQIDTDGSYEYYSEIVQIEFSPTGIKDVSTPNEFAFIENFPNPFNPSTTIVYNVPAGKSKGQVSQKVTITVFDLLGNKVAILVDDYKSPGEYREEFDGEKLSSGVYICRLDSPGYHSAIKLILMK